MSKFDEFQDLPEGTQVEVTFNGFVIGKRKGTKYLGKEKTGLGISVDWMTDFKILKRPKLAHGEIVKNEFGDMYVYDSVKDMFLFMRDLRTWCLWDTIGTFTVMRIVEIRD